MLVRKTGGKRKVLGLKHKWWGNIKIDVRSGFELLMTPAMRLLVVWVSALGKIRQISIPRCLMHDEKPDEE